MSLNPRCVHCGAILQAEVTVTFTGEMGSGKSLIQRISEEAIIGAGHLIISHNDALLHSFNVRLNRNEGSV